MAYAEAGRADDVARIMLLRGDAELEPAARLRHYVQAVAAARTGSAVHAEARRRRALHVMVVLGEEGRGATSASRRDLAEAGRELEALGEVTEAARAFERAGDVEGQARALAAAGDVEALDALLARQQSQVRDATGLRGAAEEIEMLVASGRRREAAAMSSRSSDSAVRERARTIEAHRVDEALVTVRVRGRVERIALGDEVTVGRVATIALASAAVSREHLVVVRRGDDAVVRDLGSRNGTTLRGLPVAGELPVGPGLEVSLGGQVPLAIHPDGEGGWTLTTSGEAIRLPLGPAGLGIGRWRLERGADGWVELVTDEGPPAFVGEMAMGPRIELLWGDAISTERHGPPVLILGPRLDGGHR